VLSEFGSVGLNGRYLFVRTNSRWIIIMYVKEIELLRPYQERDCCFLRVALSTAIYLAIEKQTN
jgi:hypothetical protein